MSIRMKLSSVVCLLLIAGSDAFWKKEEKNPRRRLTEKTMPTTVEMDAATGTVTSPTAAKQAQKASQTCDGQMAQSLVKANEEMMQAQALLKEAQQQNSQSLETIQTLEKSLKQAEQDSEALTVSHKSKVDQFESQIAGLKQEMVDKVEEVTKVKEERISSLTESLKMSQEELVTEYEGQLKKAEERRVAEENKWLEKLEKFQQDRAEALEESGKQLESTKSRHAEEIDELKSTLESTKAESKAFAKDVSEKMEQAKKEAAEALKTALAEQQAANESKLSEMQAKMEAQKQEAEATLQKYKDEAKAFLLVQIEAKDKEVSAAKGLAKDAQAQVKVQNRELDAWRANFANRTYCNLTHIGEDISWAGAQAYDKSAELSLQAYDTSLEYAKIFAFMTKEKSLVAWQETQKYSKQGYAKSMEIYEKQVHPQYKQHVKPLVDQHVIPLVDKASLFVDQEIKPKLSALEKEITPKYKQLKKNYEAQLDSLSVTYADVCKKSYKIVDGVAKQHNLDVWEDSIAPSFRQSCKKPKESLQAAQYGILFLLMLPFLPTLLRLVFGIVRLILRVIIAVTPLRFFISTSKNKANAVSSQSKGEVRVKKKNKKFNTQQSQ